MQSLWGYRACEVAGGGLSLTSDSTSGFVVKDSGGGKGERRGAGAGAGAGAGDSELEMEGVGVCSWKVDGPGLLVKKQKTVCERANCCLLLSISHSRCPYRCPPPVHWSRPPQEDTVVSVRAVARQDHLLTQHFPLSLCTIRCLTALHSML
jgi:hypothetical protein